MKLLYSRIIKYLYGTYNISIEKISNILTDIGLTVKDIYTITNKNKDYILNIDITPNRSDAMNHYGIARDLYAVLKFKGYEVKLIKPIEKNNICNKNIIKQNIKINLDKECKRCIRYTGISIFKEEEESTPKWLIKSLNFLGIKSINIIVDFINFVIYDFGIPIHFFYYDDKIKEIFIKHPKKNEVFFFEKKIIKNLDNNKIVIVDSKNNLLLCYNNIVNKKNIFVGSYYINNTDFIDLTKNIISKKIGDPNQTKLSLKKLYFLIKNNSQNLKFSNIFDIYPNHIYPIEIKLFYENINKIIGYEISKKNIKNILLLLKININKETNKYLLVSLPTYRLDIKREIDLIEEIIRIYGINKIKCKKNIFYQKIYNYKEENKIKKIIFEQLLGYGFKEIITYPIIEKNENSSSLNKFFKIDHVKIINSNVNNKYMRSSLLFSIANCINYNYNYNRLLIINKCIKFFEIGKIYYKKNNSFIEKTYLCISISIVKKKNILNNKKIFFYLKGVIEKIFKRTGILNYTQKIFYHPLLSKSISINYNDKSLVTLGKVKENFIKKHDIFYAEIDWKFFIKIIKKNKIVYNTLSKYPISIRDLSFLINKDIKFEILNETIKNYKNKFIQKIVIYDSYEGNNIVYNKKSYTISCIFECKENTLKNKIIDDSMNKVKLLLVNKLKAEIRKKTN